MSCDEDDQYTIPSSCDEDFQDNKNITIKFQITNSETVAQVYERTLNVSQVKEDIASKFNVDPTYLVICQNEDKIRDSLQIQELEKNEFGIVEVVLKIDINKTLERGDEEETPELNLDVYYNKFRMADFITVRIPCKEEGDGDGPPNDVVVEIQNAAINKPFLGGYVDLKTETEYFDAFTQTGPPLARMKFEGVASRDCQTAELRSKGIDTVVDNSTQAFGDARELIYISNVFDREIVARTYETFEQKERRENKLQKIILIQRNWRRYLLWRFIKQAAAEYRRLVAEQKRREIKLLDEYVDRVKRGCVTRTFPKTKEDFDLLFAQVQRWKDAEVKKINMMYSGGPRIAELHCLLDKEIQLLNGIEKQRLQVRKFLKNCRDEMKLKKLGEPVKWVGYRDIVIEMDTLRTQRVRCLTVLYKELKKDLKKEDRIKLINKICTVLEAEVDEKPLMQPLVIELVELFEREKSLLYCTKLGECMVSHLRQRQIVLFIEIMKYSEEHQPKKNESRMCDKCNLVKPLTEFALRTRQSTVDTCKSCFYLAGSGTDNSLYKAILRSVQRDERKRGTLSSYAFIMQEDDIRFIIDKVWHGHSILSKCSELSELRLPRWIKSDEWSPWNCVCLTIVEARAHKNINVLSDIYKEPLIQDVLSKHIFAKTSFRKLQDVDTDFVTSGEWWECGIKDKVV